MSYLPGSDFACCKSLCDSQNCNSVIKDLTLKITELEGELRRQKESSSGGDKILKLCGATLFTTILCIKNNGYVVCKQYRNYPLVPSKKIIISGKVQGVSYRVMAKEAADKIGITGWVKNVADNVEVFATGTDQQLLDFIQWCHNGPSRAVVSEVNVTTATEKNFKDFSVIR